MSTINRRSFLCVAGTMLATTVPAASEEQTSERQRAEAAGLIEEARGEVFAVTRAQRRELERASPVFLKDIVGTGTNSRLRLRLGADTSILLGERARLLIDRFLINAGGDITLESGAMFFEKRARDTSGITKVQTSYGLIEVRGTRFFAGPSNKVFGVFVEVGSVAISAGGTQVILKAGQGTDIARPGARPTPARQWRQARVQDAYASVR